MLHAPLGVAPSIGTATGSFNLGSRYTVKAARQSYRLPTKLVHVCVIPVIIQKILLTSSLHTRLSASRKKK